MSGAGSAIPSTDSSPEVRHDTLDRLRHSPFLTARRDSDPDVADAFLVGGAEEAAELALQVKAGLPVAVQLRRQRMRLMLALALGDLSGEFDMVEVTARLSRFADNACDAALADAMRHVTGVEGTEGVALLALGKHGGREVNYSSDIDPIIIHDLDRLPPHARRSPQQVADRIVRGFVERMQTRTADGFVFRVDLRLRPTAEVSPPSIPIAGAIAHYEGAALPWERAAFVRARAAAGDIRLGQQFLAEIAPFVWRRSLDFGARGELASLAARIRTAAGDRETAAPGGDLKRGRGGIREVEFFVQSHQLIHGGRLRTLRSPNLLTALAALGDEALVDRSTVTQMGSDYRDLRTLEHRLQMIDDRQTHALPDDRESLDRVAWLHGMTDGQALLDSLAPVVDRVAGVFAELHPDTPTGLPADPARLAARLSSFGDGEAAARTIAGWRVGSAPALRSAAAQDALEAALPALVDGLATADAPLLALHRLDDVVRRVPSAINLFRLLQANPPIARLLAETMAASPTLADRLADRPQLLDRLLDASALDPLPAAQTLEADWWRDMAPLDQEPALDRLRDRVNEERFAIGVRLIAGVAKPAALSRELADVAEVATRLALRLTERDFAGRHGTVGDASLIVLALGRLGGRALTPASDLDLILLHDASAGARASGPGEHDATIYFNRLGQRVVAALSVPTAAGPLYDVDTRLRPSGAQGPLVPSVAAFRRYGLEEAWVWERMALCRARVIGGTTEGQARAADALAGVLTIREDATQIRSEAVAMRERMAASKPQRGPLDVKLMPGGLVDLEFIVHVEQLTSGFGMDPVLDDAVAALVSAGRLDPDCVAAARTLADTLFVLRLTAPGGELTMDAARRRTSIAAGRRDMAELNADLRTARHVVVRQWRRTFGEDRHGWSDDGFAGRNRN